ncbi:DUF4399 domain-containing protein [Salsipaludibacter albus]|uniref:DUF4399 domain-containing protein n=1 Tax=Salsipaludibacter albus TaxID=2849650 RepID=UPI001EE3E55F|nr:DUF4399 domain-containing protein [Salsipaludibacter albus]MBY5163253.1 DUF4399 domain-containing protein [Salsipaludibacter albus]
MMTARRATPALALAGAMLLGGCTSGPAAEPSPDSASSVAAPSASPSAASPSQAPSASPSEAKTIPLPNATTGGGAGDSDDTATATPAPAPTSTASASPSSGASAPERSLAIEAPADGDEVSSPLTLEVAFDGFELVELGTSMEPAEGHLWAFVDVEPPDERVRLPDSTSIVKSAEPTIELGALEPGEHTVTVLASHGYPVPFEPRITDTVTFTVTE